MRFDIHIDNETLVAECKSGNQEALNLFYTRFAPRMMGVIHRYIKDSQDAEDILHDGFIIAFTHLGSLRESSHADFWLASIMKNLSLQFLKEQDISHILHQIPEIEAESSYPDDFIDLATIEKLIRKLPTGYQTVFRLSVLENKSHKEIGKLLGIAPNSSSSQLFHAKMMMRQLITDYRRQAGLLSIMLIAISSGLILTNKETLREQDDTVPESILISRTGDPDASSEHKSHNIASATINSTPNTMHNTLPSANFAKMEGENIAASDPLKTELEPTGSTSLIPTVSGTESNPDETTDSIPYDMADDTYYADSSLKPDMTNLKKGWSFGIGLNPGFLNFQDHIGNDDALSSYPGIDQTPDDGKEEEKGESYFPNPATRSVSTPSFDRYRYANSHHHLPLAFSLTAVKSMGKRFGVETGVTYTYLHTTFEYYDTKAEAYWHYIGIPVKLHVNNLSFGKINLYASIGGAIDFPIYSNATSEVKRGIPDLPSGKFNSSIAWSLSGSYGISYQLSDRIELFAEPTLQYHFPHDNDVPSIWQDNPWGFSLPIGLRLKW